MTRALPGQVDPVVSAKWLADLQPQNTDLSWTSALVRQRLDEAMKTLRLVGGKVGPLGVRTSMPGVARSPLLIAELIEQMYDPSLYRQDTSIRFAALSSEIARMEEANHWPWRYLADHDGPRRVLIAWLKSRASPHERFSRLCRASGWPKSTAKDALARACGLIAAGLNGEHKPVR
jgi:hypothetical protein